MIEELFAFEIIFSNHTLSYSSFNVMLLSVNFTLNLSIIYKLTKLISIVTGTLNRAKYLPSLIQNTVDVNDQLELIVPITSH